MNTAALKLVPQAAPSHAHRKSVAWPGPSTRADFTGEDLRFMQASGISLDVLYATGARSATEQLVQDIGLAYEWKNGARGGVIFYLHRPDGTVSAQWRPNTPPKRSRGEAKPPKYLFAPGMHTAIWVHPIMKNRRQNADVFVLCEGTKQYLAAVSTYSHRDDVVVMGTPGCYGWSEDKAVSPDLLAMVPSSATLVVIFDADLTSNPSVWGAGASLDNQLGEHGITTRFACLPDVTAGTDGLDDLLSAMPSENREAWLDSIIQTAAPLPAQPRGFLDSGVPVTLLAVRTLRKEPPQPWPDVLARGEGWSLIHRPHEHEVLAAVRDPSFTGVVRLKRGEEVWTAAEVADFVPWRSERIQTRRGATTIGETQWNVRVVTGTTTWTATMDDKGSLSPAAVQEATGAAIALPVERVDLNALRTTLSMLGAHERRDAIEYASTGWHKIDGLWTMVAPAGSINSEGICTAPVVSTTPGHMFQASVGWARVPATTDEHRRGVEALVGLSRVLPERRDVGMAMVGALCAAPLGMKRRTSAFFQAEAGTGKSVMMRLASGAISVDPDGHFLVSVPKATALGAVSQLEWSRHLPAFVDDYRRSPDPSAQAANAQAAAVLAQVAQCCYSGDAEAKRTLTGKLRDTADVNTLAIITAEAMSTESAITERMVCCQISKGDFPSQDDPSDPIHAYDEQFVMTGDLNLGYAGFVQYLARVKDAGRDIASEASALARTNARTLGHGRAGETAGVIGVGWAYLRMYAEWAGAADLLPSVEEVRAAMAGTVAASTAHNVEVNPTDRLVKALRDMLAGAKGHLRVPDSTFESKGEVQTWGWRPRNGEMQGAGEELGILTQHAVIITAAGLKAARRFAELDGLTMNQCKDALAKACLQGTAPGDRVSTDLDAGRRRGYALPRELFDDPSD